MTIINMAGGKAQKPIVVEAVEDTPSTLPHTYEPREGVDYLSSVTVGKDPNLVPGNVKKDVSIFGTVGTLANEGSADIAEYVIPWRCHSLPFIPLTEYEAERPSSVNPPVWFNQYYTSATLADATTGDVHVKPNPRISYYTGTFPAMPIQVDIAQGAHTSLAVNTLWDSSGSLTNLASEIRTSISQVFPGVNSTELPFTGQAIPVAFCEGTGAGNTGIGWDSQPDPIDITGTLGSSSSAYNTMTVNIPSDISMLCYCRGNSTDKLYTGLAIIDLTFDMEEFI